MLRTSRVCSSLIKEALVGRALKLGLKGVDSSVKGVGGFIRRHPTGALVASGAIGSSVPVLSRGIESGVSGVSPDYLRAQRLGYLKETRVPYPYSF